MYPRTQSVSMLVSFACCVAGSSGWSKRLALAPVRPLTNVAASSHNTSPVLIAIVNFSPHIGPHIIILRAQRHCSDEGRLSALCTLTMFNPTSCCFSRGQLAVGGIVASQQTGAHVDVKIPVTAFSTLSWDKLGTLVSSDQRTGCTLRQASSMSRVHALEDVVLFDIVRRDDNQGATRLVVCAMRLRDLDDSNSGHLVLGSEARNATLTFAELQVTSPELLPDVMSMFSTPRRVLILTSDQVLHELVLD